jgi:hypothetical protein
LSGRRRGDNQDVGEETMLPRDLAVPCSCGGAVPLLLFVYDGRPHNQAQCPSCNRRVFLTPPPHVHVG